MLTCCVLLAGLAAAPVSAQLREFRFTKLNRSYDSIVEELAPVSVGPATVRLSTPQHELRLQSHSVELIRGSASGFGAVLRLTVSGSGLIDADVSMGSVQTRISDRLTLPEQSLSVVGRVSVAPDESGYLVRVLQLQEDVEVAIESQLARQLSALCRPMGLVLVNLDCVSLERSLTRIRVPLPQDEAAYTLPYDELTSEERLRFDQFIDRLGG